MAKAEETRHHPGPSIYLFEALLAASSGTVGMFRITNEGTASARSVLMMLALPAAAALIAGSLGRLSVEGRPRLHWSIIPSLPIMHGAALFALAKLVEAKYTGIEAPERIHPSLVWSDPMLIALSAAAQVLALSILFAFVSRK